MHRISAMDDPDAPLGHHWQDSSHVTFGVATAGLVWRTVKIEGSVFTGREPDEDRYDFDRPRFDSASGRISWNPTPDLALQFSHGYLKSPEGPSPPRTGTAPLLRSYIIRRWATTRIGPRPSSGDRTTTPTKAKRNPSSSNPIFSTGVTPFIPGSSGWKNRDTSSCSTAADLAKIFPIYAASFGYVRDLSHGTGIDIGLGAQFTIDHRPDELDRYYGDEIGYGFQVFLRIRPSRHAHGEMMETMK